MAEVKELQKTLALLRFKKKDPKIIAEIRKIKKEIANTLRMETQKNVK